VAGFSVDVWRRGYTPSDQCATDTWIIGPALKMVAEFEESTKEHSLIAMGTPDPYTPPK